MTTSVVSRPSSRPFVPPPAPKTPKSAGTRRRLLDLAARLFIDRGYQAVSMRDIAAAAEVTKGAVYGHFRSKGQLLVEVIRWKIAEQDRSTDFVEAEANPLNGVAMMHDDAGRETRLLEVDAAAAARHDPEVAAGLTSLYQERHARIRDAMSGLADPDTAAWVLAALSAGIGMKEASGLPLPDARRLSTTVLAAVDGLISQQVR
jgi:TetR/AcrR family transcriptional repressor of nem operon